MKTLFTIVTLLACVFAKAQSSIVLSNGDTLKITAPYKIVPQGVKSFSLTLPVIDTLKSVNVNLQKQIDAIPRTVLTALPKRITASSYTVTNADNNTALLFATSCNVYFSSTITMPFTCTFQQQGGTIAFAGSINSAFGYRRSQTQWCWVTAIATSNGTVGLSGSLKN